MEHGVHNVEPDQGTPIMEEITLDDKEDSKRETNDCRDVKRHAPT